MSLPNAGSPNPIIPSSPNFTGNTRTKGLRSWHSLVTSFFTRSPAREAHDFACTRFQAEYAVFQKVRVNGQNAAPLYKFLKASKPTFLGSRIKWNFTKFLVSKDGIVIDRYGTMVTPLSIEKDIKKALEKA
uniref:Glutathione peroxidase n=1 Tax=Brassica oleracea var. oleracea TaxID=109376 RepID=A0A0D3DZJ0_BRAOL